MPSPKTASKPEAPKEELIEVTAVRKFAVEYSPAELKAMQGSDKEKRSFAGLSRMIEIGKSAFVTKEIASKLQDAGAVKVKL